jgi:uncharacterized protein (TIGR01777 family)
MRIVIPGGSGQVGTLLARHFHAQGHQVTVLSRDPRPASAPWQLLDWDGVTAAGNWVAALEGADLCINLAGRSVNCRYGPENRRQIYDSRILSTRLLNQVIANLDNPPRLWLNSSTATIYRHSFDYPNDEATGELGGNEPGAPDTWNFSIKVAKDWEEAFFATETPRTRKIALRSAVTFSPDPGGIFAVLSNLVRRGLGGTNGSGHQMVSWVHHVDFVRVIDFLIVNESFAGVVNIASPNPLPNREFMRALRHAWGVPFGLPAPAWLIEIGSFFLRTESELVLKSRNVIPGRLEQAGFQFHFPHWPEAAIDMVNQWRGQNPVASV